MSPVTPVSPAPSLGSSSERPEDSPPDFDVSQLAVVEAGTEGPLVLCLHGIGGSSASFAAQIGELSTVARVLAWDAPGYAGSADPERAPGLDGYADAAAALIRSRGTVAHVIGVSWGGAIALRLAARYPNLVASLVIADATMGSAADPEKAAAMRARAEELQARGATEFAARRAPRLLGPNAPRELTEAVTRNMAESIRLPGYGYAAQALAETDLTAELASVHAPALVLCGEEDQITGISESQAIAGGVRSGVFVILADAGHLANQEQPEAFNDWARAHLRVTALIPELA